MSTTAKTNQYLICVRQCQQWQECGIWCGRAPDITPSRHCDWWPNGMPHTNEDANGVYVRHLEANLSKSSNSCEPPRSALAPSRLRNLGPALVALCGIVAMAGMLGATFVIFYVLLSLAARAI